MYENRDFNKKNSSWALYVIFTVAAESEMCYKGNKFKSDGKMSSLTAFPVFPRNLFYSVQ